jgi:hypothetical protein
MANEPKWAPAAPPKEAAQPIVKPVEATQEKVAPTATPKNGPAQPK